jgi:phage terminase large subunit-like protein
MALQSDQPLQEAAIKERCAVDFEFFRNYLVIDGALGPVEFDEVIAPFQEETFQAVGPSLEALQQGAKPEIQRFWIERTKKASKDADLAVMLLWLVAFAQRPIYGQVGAADRDQAAIVKRRMEALLELNEWLKDLVEIQRNHIKQKPTEARKTGLAVVDILAADVAGSHGETPDFLVINELSHVTAWEFVENLMDNATGVPHGVVIIATNAGFKRTKPHVWRKNAIESEEWSVHLWEEPSPWLSEKMLEDAKRRNTRSRYLRLYYGVWASGRGDALNDVKVEQIFREDLFPLAGREEGWFYLGGLDLGVSHDHCGLVVAGVHVEQRRIRIGRIEEWKPPEGGEVDLHGVQETVHQAHLDFRLSWCGYDPAQAKLMAQNLARRGVPMIEVNFGPSNLTKMADTLKQVVEGGLLECFPSESLERDFGKLNIVEKTYGLKLEATSDEFGHADVATALVILLPQAVRMLSGWRLQPTDDIGGYHVDPDKVEEVIQGMHPEMAELCGDQDFRNVTPDF